MPEIQFHIADVRYIIYDELIYMYKTGQVDAR